MKPCPACYDTSPDDARFCITCGHAFAATGATERISSAGQQTQRLSDSGPWGTVLTLTRWRPVAGSISAITIGQHTFSAGTVFVPLEHTKPIYTYDKLEPISYLINGSVVGVQPE